MVKHQHKVFFRGAFKQFFQRATVFDELVVAAGDGYVAESERAVFEDGKAGVFQRLDVFVDFAAIVFMVADNGQIGGFAVDFSEFGGEVQRTEMVGGAFDNVAGKNGKVRIDAVDVFDNFGHLIQTQAAIVDMQVGNQRQGKVDAGFFRMDLVSGNADTARIEKAVKTDERSQCGKPPGSGVRVGKIQVGIDGNIEQKIADDEQQHKEKYKAERQRRQIENAARKGNFAAQRSDHEPKGIEKRIGNKQNRGTGKPGTAAAGHGKMPGDVKAAPESQKLIACDGTKREYVFSSFHKG